MPRLEDDRVYRWYLALPQAFEDPANITSAELNANPTNDPSGLIWNITCALDTDGSVFDLDEPDYDESLSFCQEAGSREPMAKNANVVFQAFRATAEGKTDGTPGWNNAHLAFTLLAWRGVEYLAILSIGEDEDTPFDEGDRISVVQVATDNGIDVIGSGENVRLQSDTANRGVWAWNYELPA